MLRKIPNSTTICVQALALYTLFYNKWYWINYEIPYLPFISFLDLFKGNIFLQIIIQGVVWVSYLLIFSRWNLKVGALLLGIAGWALVFSSLTIYSTNILFANSILLIIGFDFKKEWPLRMQMSIIYFGGFLNKVITESWQNGEFYDGFTEVFRIIPFEILEGIVSNNTAGLIFCWITIAFELCLSILFLFKKTIRYALILGIIFHGSMYLFTLGVLSFPYLYKMIAVYILFIPWFNKSDGNKLFRNKLFWLLIFGLFILIDHYIRF